MKRATILCAALVACDGASSGDNGFVVELSFADDALPAPGVPLDWSLEISWPGGAARNHGRYDGSALTVSSVPEGSDRQVKVELSADGHVYYHGQSQPFDLRETRRVAVVLRSSPAGDITLIGAAGAGEDAGLETHSAVVDVHITVDAGVRIRLSDDPAAIATQGTVRTLAELTAAGGAYRWEDWPLEVVPCCDPSQSDPEACAPAGQCRQRASVYALLFDDDGYTSELLEASIDFDSRNWDCPPGETGSAVCRPTCGDLVTSPCANVILVAATSPTPSQQDGATWPTAYADLQTALGVAAPGDEIWVAAGVYQPDQGPLATDDDAESTFQLKESVAMYGCFSATEQARDHRDCTANETVLWGDLDGEPSINGAAAYHVVRAGQVTAATILDGFTVTGGQADGGNQDDFGGGMTIRDGQPTIRNCVFRDNSGMRGGAMHIKDSPAWIEGVTFEDNVALFGGGAVAITGDLAPTFEDCSFTGNRVTAAPLETDTDRGGGALNVFRIPGADIGQLTIRRCRFIANEATQLPGGAIFVSGTLASTKRSMVVSSLFLGNRADDGGAVYNQGTGQIDLINVTMVSNCNNWYRNDATGGPPVAECLFADPYYQGTIYDDDGEGTVVLANSILWGNAPMELVGSVDVTYSCVAGGAAGVGNIDCDPGFVDADGADGVPGNGDDDLHPGTGSPAIDAGDTRAISARETLDLDGNARLVDDPDSPDTGIGAGPVVDMGAYEYAGDGG